LSIESVLNCPHLPSLPAIAAQVLELTSRQDVPIREIASVVQNDQALAVKILKTVNSSYYGLTSPCPTIDRAMSYLGLNTVKSLVLGFSFVDSHREVADLDPPSNAFNLTEHWRRAIYGASAARLIAQESDSLDPDEAFLAALMQDVGMLALFVNAGEEYAAAIDSCEGDNERVVEIEKAAFGITHTEVGAALAGKWRLPVSIVETARHHHEPGDAPGPHAPFVRCGGLASLMASAAAQQASERELTIYLQRARAWFGLDRERAEELLRMSVNDAVQLSTLFAVDTGKKPDLSALLAEANAALAEHQMETQRQADGFARQAYTDGLTQVANRTRFDELLTDAFDTASQADTALTVFFCDADRFKVLNDTHGHQAGDAVLVELARRLTDAIGSAGTLCRYGGEEFAAVLPGLCGAEAAVVAERCRASVQSDPFDLRAVGCGVEELPVTISVGIASREAGSGGAAKSAEFLLRAADKAVYAAKDAGRNCVRMIRLRGASCDAPAVASSPKQAAPRPNTPAPSSTPTPARQPQASGVATAPSASEPKTKSPFRILFVEDDSLQQRMVSLPISREPGLAVDVAADGASAKARLAESAESTDDNRYRLILLDVGLPDAKGDELVRHIRSCAAHATVPVVMLSASEDDDDIRACLVAGANAYITKQSICDDPKSRILNIVQFWTTTCRAA
jgi:diguanylate cyclase (GGDEF)-like protein